MSRSPMIRWIENAEARRFSEATLFEQRDAPPARHHRPFSDTIARVPAWLNALAHIGCARGRRRA